MFFKPLVFSGAVTALISSLALGGNAGDTSRVSVKNCTGESLRAAVFVDTLPVDGLWRASALRGESARTFRKDRTWHVSGASRAEVQVVILRDRSVGGTILSKQASGGYALLKGTGAKDFALTPISRDECPARQAHG